MAGIHAYAVHLPRLTLAAQEVQRHQGRAPPRLEARRVHDHDEDEATLAVAAARALRALPGPAPASVVTASASGGPFGALVAEALGGLGGARVLELRGPTAGLQALLAARDMLGQGAAMVVSADAPAAGPGDGSDAGQGSASTAWLLAAKGPLQLRREAHAAAPGVALGDPEHALARALAALTRAGLHADGVGGIAAQDLDRGLLAAAQRVFPKARAASVGPSVGDAGATAPLLALARAAEEASPGEALVACAAGAGLGLALAFEAEQAPAARTLREALAAPHEALDYPRWARLRSPAARPDVSQGAAVSAAQYQDSLPARLRWEGQRCGACGRVQFPPRAGCLGCGKGSLEPHALEGRGTVHSVVTIGRGSAPAEFAEQQRRAGAYDVAVVELAGGPRVAAMLCDAAPGQARIGDAVELVVRRLYVQDGAPRYGFKARLLAGA